MVCGAFYKPKVEKWKPQGDDAYFICAEKHTIGVADGVGGWSESGVDAGQYAQDLMANCVKAVGKAKKGKVDPRWILDEAYKNTNVEGSSTACILTLKNNSGLRGFQINRSAAQIQPGVVIVMGTDGLWDNMFSKSICDIVKKMTECSSEPKQAARALAKHAYCNSVNSLAPTPFMQAALMAGNNHLGGNADDITVIMAYVVVK